MYNAAGTLKKCFDAIFAQTYKPMEIVIVDDGSTDDSPRMAKEWGARYFAQPKNQGPAMARNRCAVEAKGDVLFFVDSDTAMHPDAIENMVKTITKPGIDAVAGRYAKESLNKGLVPEYYCLLKNFSKTFSGIEDHCVFCGECIGVWREAFLDSGGYNPIPWGTDVENEEFGRRFIKKYKIVIDPSVQVGHHFPHFQKLMKLFYSRTYWWVRFYFVHKTFEKALTTKSFAAGAVSGAAIPVLVIITGISAWLTGAGWWTIGFGALALASIAVWINAFGSFLEFCRREKGVWFMIESGILNMITSYPIALGAVAGLIDHARKGPPDFEGAIRK